MEEKFCSVSLDIIGRAVFNYDFGSTNSESPVIKVSTGHILLYHMRTYVIMHCAGHRHAATTAVIPIVARSIVVRIGHS